MMNRTDHPLAAWLGPALGDLTDGQLERLTAESARIDTRYPDPDEQYLRDAAMTATMQHILSETTIDQAGNTLLAARIALGEAIAASKQLAVMAVADGMSEVSAAQRAGLDRMTVRKVLGK